MEPPHTQPAFDLPDPKVVHEYSRVLADLTNVITNEQFPMILSVLENVPDEARDLHSLFAGDQRRLHHPIVWLDYVRLARFCVHLKAELSAQYDLFVQAYQTLSVKPNPATDEQKLLREIGDFMYVVDDLAGNYERLSIRVITELSKSLKLTYGILYEPNDLLYSHPVHEDHASRILPLIGELIQLCDQMREQVKIMVALERMRRLLLKF